MFITESKKKMSNEIRILIVCLLGLFLLAVSNPDKKDLKLYIQEKLQKEEAGKDSNLFLEQAVASFLVELGTYRSNDVIFSIFTVNLPGHPPARLLGIGGHFFPMGEGG